MKRALFFATLATQIDFFNLSNIRLLQNMGYQVDVACNFEKGNPIKKDQVNRIRLELEEIGVKCFQVPVPRKISDLKSLKTSFDLAQILYQERKYDIVHCHSPIASVIVRWALRNKPLKMIYTAHGFHFYNGATLLNWLIYYPIEYMSARYTDLLITINNEDYQSAKKFPVRKKVVQVPGVGVDLERFNPTVSEKDKITLAGITVEPDDFLCLSIGELNAGKNHRVIIEALAASRNKKIKYIILGEGEARTSLEKLRKEYSLENRVALPGYQKDTPSFLRRADVFVFPSLREGLPLSVMEAMATALPCIVSDVRGNRELVDHEKGGFIAFNNTAEEYRRYLEKLIEEPRLAKEFGNYNLEKIKDYSLDSVNNKMKAIYETI